MTAVFAKNPQFFAAAADSLTVSINGQVFHVTDAFCAISDTVNHSVG